MAPYGPHRGTYVVRRVRPEQELFRPVVPGITKVRYVFVTVLYLLFLLLCALTACAVAVAFILDTPTFAQRIFDHLAAVITFMVGTGGIGAFFAKVDESERHNARCDRLLESLMRMPDTPEKREAITGLVQQMTSRSMFFGG